MELWMLVSIFRDQPEVLAEVLGRRVDLPFARLLANFKTLVAQQERQTLDLWVPPVLVHEALERLDLSFVLERGWLRRRRPELAGVILSALQVAERFGPATIEEVLEKGSVEVAE